MPQDVSFQADMAVRLIVAAALGAAIGLEREIHGHPAGMRTHMLVSLGSAIFTVLSIYGFPRVAGTAATDPSRIAAQIVSGIGFLGAGAIVKYGTNIRGLTTAASLWVIAAVGLAAGAGAYGVAVAGTLVGVLSLWPLHLLVARLAPRGARLVHLHLELEEAAEFAAVTRLLGAERVDVVTLRSERLAGDARSMDLELRMPSPAATPRVVAALSELPGVSVAGLTQAEEA